MASIILTHKPFTYKGYTENNSTQNITMEILKQYPHKMKMINMHGYLQCQNFMSKLLSNTKRTSCTHVLKQAWAEN